ncbi:MAG: DnaA ATPase domain-containing protein [Planctomycetota bacterium]
MDDTDIVSAVREALIDKVGSDTFDLWFRAPVTMEWTGEQLLVVAPTHFILERLRRTMRKEMVAACQLVVGSAVQVEFQLAKDVPTAGVAATSMNSRLLSSTPARSAEAATVRRRALPDREAITSHRSADSSATAANGLRVVGRSGTVQVASAARSRPEPTPEVAQREVATVAPRAVRDWQSFVVGDANRVAVAAAQRVAAQPGTNSPLYLHGTHGCGKTHLLEALTDLVRRSRKLKRVVSLTAEQFTSQFLEALQGSGLPSFRRKYRDVDMLVIDDVQFFVGKTATINEFQSTIDALRRQGKQVVIAADRPPAELRGLGPELIARLSEGTSCQVDGADVTMRREIAARAAQRLQLAIPTEVLGMLSEQLTGDVRFLLGAINRLGASSEALKQPITSDFAFSVLADLFRATRRVVRLADIERAVCNVFGIETQSLQSDRKIRTVSQPRMLAMWLARKHTRSALSEIGSYFGLRSHTSVISAQRRVERLLTTRDANQVQRLECSFVEAVRRVELQLRTGS